MIRISSFFYWLLWFTFCIAFVTITLKYIAVGNGFTFLVYFPSFVLLLGSMGLFFDLWLKNMLSFKYKIVETGPKSFEAQYFVLYWDHTETNMIYSREEFSIRDVYEEPMVYDSFDKAKESIERHRLTIKKERKHFFGRSVKQYKKETFI